MKHSDARLIVAIAVAAALVGVGRPGALPEPGEDLAPVGEQARGERPAAQLEDLAALIVGEWELAPYGGVLSGWIAFQADGTYETEEQHVDGVGVGRKGGYLLDAAASPPRIRLCAGDCGAPGSEWTSLFCVLRPHGEDRLEICFSPDGSYPTRFDPEDADHTMILDRRRP